MNTNLLVDWPGHGRFWVLLDDSGGGALARLEQCDAHGDLVDLATALRGNSYAHLLPDGTIVRNMQIIGHRNDLQPVSTEPA